MTTDPNRTLGLQCLQRCQHIEPRCIHCPKDSVPVMSYKPIRSALILMISPVLIGEALLFMDRYTPMDLITDVTTWMILRWLF